MKNYSDFMTEITPNELYKGLLAYGMFSEKIPPMFSSESFFEYCFRENPSFEDKWRSFIQYDSMRNTNVIRELGIPTPMAYHQLCNCLKNKHDYKNVVLKGNWNEDPTTASTYKKACPMCGYPMQFRYKAAYGLRLHICTNEPEVCGFMTNTPAAGKLSIIKCDQCRDGYLVVKPGKDKTRYMLGCTNYKSDGSGCSRIMSPKYFCEYMHITDMEPAEPILYCIRVKKCSLNEVQAYLLYRYGLGMAKRKMTESTFYHCKKRAEEIAEEQNGRLD